MNVKRNDWEVDYRFFYLFFSCSHLLLLFSQTDWNSSFQSADWEPKSRRDTHKNIRPASLCLGTFCPWAVQFSTQQQSYLAVKRVFCSSCGPVRLFPLHSRSYCDLIDRRRNHAWTRLWFARQELNSNEQKLTDDFAAVRFGISGASSSSWSPSLIWLPPSPRASVCRWAVFRKSTNRHLCRQQFLHQWRPASDLSRNRGSWSDSEAVTTRNWIRNYRKC